MQTYLVVILFCIYFHKIIFCASTFTSKVPISSVFEGLGFSPSCVANSLASCERSALSRRIIDAEDNLAITDDQNAESKRSNNCDELLSEGDTISGVRTIYPYECCRDRAVVVYCDQNTDGGGWTVFQKRVSLPHREDFYRTWVEYVLGFGNVTGEYWLGLDNIHALVSSKLMEMRVDLEDYEGNESWAKYGVFYVSDSSSKYQLRVGRFSGNTGDSLKYHNGSPFSTIDQENEKWNPENCAVVYKGAWWYTDHGCHQSNLNGLPLVGQHASYADGINWLEFRGHYYSLKITNMKVRPAFKPQEVKS